MSTRKPPEMTQREREAKRKAKRMAQHAAREEARGAREKARLAERDRCMALVHSMPAAHSTWGVLRTQAYVLALRKLSFLVFGSRVGTREKTMADRRAIVQRLAVAPIEECARYLEEHDPLTKRDGIEKELNATRARKRDAANEEHAT